MSNHLGSLELTFARHEPDTSAFDETHPYYVQNAKQRGTKDKPRWSLVHVEFRKKLSKPVRYTLTADTATETIR